MIELLTTFSFSQIVLFIIMLVIAAKEFLVLLDFFYDRVRKHFDSGYSRKNDINKILETIEKHEARSEDRALEYTKLANQVTELAKQVEEDSARQEARIDLLTRSDKNSIKSFIVKEYHYFTEKIGWIDDFSMDVIEQRFASYEEEGGNSYIHALIDRLRELPKCPPDEK